jgi:hypothetical protein
LAVRAIPERQRHTAHDRAGVPREEVLEARDALRGLVR